MTSAMVGGSRPGRILKSVEEARRAPLPRRVARSAAGLAARSTSGARMLPDYLIIGAKRSGSTSLHEYLVQHPSVARSHFAKGSHYFDVNYPRGWAWFRSHFPTVLYRSYARSRGLELIVGDSSPYYAFHPLALPRIKAALPDVKLIFLLRDPVERAWSHYRYERARGFEEESAPRAFDLEPTRLAGEAERMAAEPTYQSFHHRHHSYLARGVYIDQIQVLHSLFPREQVMLLQAETLFADPEAQMSAVFEFLRLPPHRLAQFDRFMANTNTASAGMDPATRRYLSEYYRDPNQRLYEELGINFGWTRPE